MEFWTKFTVVNTVFCLNRFSYQHVLVKDLLPYLFFDVLQVHLTADDDSLRHFKHQKGPGRQTDRQLAVGLKSCSVSSSSSFSASPPAVCCYCCSSPSGFTYRSQWRTGHVASPANDLTGLIVPFIC